MIELKVKQSGAIKKKKNNFHQRNKMSAIPDPPRSAGPAVLQVRNVVKRYGGLAAVDDHAARDCAADPGGDDPQGAGGAP